MEITLDTNIICVLCNAPNAPHATEFLTNLIEKNRCVVSYGTLFELFSKYHDDDFLNHILTVLNEKKIVIATNSEVNVDLFYNLIYCGEELSNLGLQKVAMSLFEQTSGYINNFLSQLFDIFCVLYAYMKLNRISDAYEAYLGYTATLSNDFANFNLTTRPFFSNNFALSYAGKIDKKFEAVIKNAFWKIVSVIESRYIVLNGHPKEYLDELDWEPAFSKARQDFEAHHRIDDYQNIVRCTYRELRHGQKKLNNIDELFSYVNCSQLSDLEQDFMVFYLKRLLTSGSFFHYNDIIDFMNLSIAKQHTDCFLTTDIKFLSTRAANFQSVVNSQFYKQSLALSQQLFQKSM